MHLKTTVCFAGVLAALITVSHGQNPVSDACLRCICDASSGCDPTVGCTGDQCGMFQLTWSYWADAGKPVRQGDVPYSQNAFANCANDFQCAASAVQGYMRKFGQDCNRDGVVDCLDHAAIHKLGGYGCNSAVPYAYQSKVAQCLQRAAGPQY